MPGARQMDRWMAGLVSTTNIVTGNIRVLGMDGHRVQDVVDNLLFLLEFLRAHRWPQQGVKEFLIEAKKKPSWPHARFGTDVCFHAAILGRLSTILTLYPR